MFFLMSTFLMYTLGAQELPCVGQLYVIIFLRSYVC